MTNQSYNDDELFELNKDLNNLPNINADLSSIENQLGQHKNISAPSYLKNTIILKTNSIQSLTFIQLLPLAAAIFLICFAGLFYIFSHQTKTIEAPEQINNESNKVASILEKEMGTNSTKTQKYYALYFSSSLCKPCVDLLAELDTFYLEQKAKNPDFEILYIETDKHIHSLNTQATLHFKKVDYNNLHDKEFFKQYKENHGPSFVVLDNKGNVVTKHQKNNPHNNTFSTVLTAFSDLLSKS
jgi:thioredoxin-related protein